MALASFAKNLTTQQSLSQDISVLDLFAGIISKNVDYIQLWKQTEKSSPSQRQLE